MKKIPTLFEREFANHRVVNITDKVTPGMEWVLDGEGEATLKWDGSCCAIIDGVFYRRYDAKKGKRPPEGAIPCCNPDPVTGHHPHWVKVNWESPDDKWFVRAYENTWTDSYPPEGTYEAVGPHFNGNAYKLEGDKMVPHGKHVVCVDRTFAAIRDFLKHRSIEGLVFWKDGEPKCKIKRSDFGFEWPIEEDV